MDISFPTVEKIQVIMTTAFGKIPLDVYSSSFDWRGLIVPPIKSIVVSQGHHAAEIGDYEQYNFMIEVTQQMVGMGTTGAEYTTPRRFWVMGLVDKRVDLYIFECQQGIITKFIRETQPWGAELDGASTTGWKVGYSLDKETGIISTS